MVLLGTVPPGSKVRTVFGGTRATVVKQSAGSVVVEVATGPREFEGRSRRGKVRTVRIREGRKTETWSRSTEVEVVK